MKKYILAIFLILFITTNVSALTLDVNAWSGSGDGEAAVTTLEDGIMSAPVDANFRINIGDINLNDCVYITLGGVDIESSMDLNIFDDGNGFVQSLESPTTGGSHDQNFCADENGLITDTTHINLKLGVLAEYTPGYKQLCAYDRNEASACEYIGIKPGGMTTTSYSGYTLTSSGTPFAQITDYTSIALKIDEDNGNGDIEFLDPIDMNSGITTIASGITEFSKRKLTLNIPELNGAKARITFDNPEIPDEFEVRRNGSGCSVCNLIGSDGSSVVFDTTQFSTYEIVETSSDNGVSPGGTGGRIGDLPLIGSGGLMPLAIDSTTLIIAIIVVMAIVLVVILARKKK